MNRSLDTLGTIVRLELQQRIRSTAWIVLVSVVFVSSAAASFTTPSSPIPVHSRSRLVTVVFVSSAAASSRTSSPSDPR